MATQRERASDAKGGSRTEQTSAPSGDMRPSEGQSMSAQGGSAQSTGTQSRSGQGTSRQSSSGQGFSGQSSQQGTGRQSTGGQGTGLTTRGRNPLRSAPAGWPRMFSGGIPSPWELVRRVNDEMAQLVESLGVQSANGPSGAGGDLTDLPMWVPQIEVEQRDDELVIRADLPGLKPNEVNVSVQDGTLRIFGERKQEQREEQDGVIRTERVYGTFLRTFALPDGVDENQVEATFRDGVLEIRIPVGRSENEHRVEVRS